MDDDLKKAIESKGTLQSIPKDEIERREAEKKKRMEELKLLATKLEANGKE